MMYSRVGGACCARRLLLASLLGAAVLAPALNAAPPPNPTSAPHRVTILYDAFGGRAGLTRDWGFAALVEYGGKRILFDTGNNAETFARNVRALEIDLSRLDFVVISHRHGDHTSGLNYLLRVNPNVQIYAPREAFGLFGAAIPASFYRRDSSLPDSMRYFDGGPPAEWSSGTPWPQARIRWIDSLTEVAPGVSLIPTVSTTPGTLELRELSMAVRTPEGLVLLVGCSHPGIETIVEASRAVGDNVHIIFGGLHLATTPDSAVARIASSLEGRWGVDRIAPGHCTGEPAFTALQRTFGRRYVYAGLGVATEVP
jgi:7,8-dihydropterin-6-yl-methyl-4-(beta-D-ribofuranosyl)aminobenzene 5'-phosphate synthase